MARIQIRRGTAAQWKDANPVLHPGEPGWETDTKKLKIGDGVNRWIELEYFGVLEINPIDTDPDTGEQLAPLSLVMAHIVDGEPHLVYDDAPSLALLYQNAKV